ncbi:4Fe-4S binding protein [Paludibacterium purpuratum]|uniref:NosR/NirI family nitrous oxide reductase transcriptional regulator n=1 Tax=Paludibacterium purpuratum TaxID=1144873 RepID=A0A4V3DVM6_9NEIS|nr:4Fe-4S binding protein [Paludibacterium purpuratum]TDR81529.1 NosR/NirI family nitrous oxide reductase transcriptional regulator [Paludibacterium purpuratum]
MRALLSLISLTWVILFASHAMASVYEQELPPELFSAGNMCQWVDCKAVLPGANAFSNRKGSPPYVEAYRNEGQQHTLKGYVFLSTDIVDIMGYSGKPIVTLIGMDPKGNITGVRVLKHSEPILLVGIPENKLLAFLQQYVGKFAGSRFEIGKGETGATDIDAISGATVTVISENQLISRSAVAIASQVGIMKEVPLPQAKLQPFTHKYDWNSLLNMGAVQHLSINATDVGLPASGTPYLDLYYGYLNAPAIGRSILGDYDYEQLMHTLKPGEHALFVVANGTESFKGSGFVRGGIYDRIQVKQGINAFTFKDTDYLNLYNMQAAGAPSFNETGIFIIRSGKFSAAYPWQFDFLGHKLDQETGAKTFSVFDAAYWLPADFLTGGRPVVAEETPSWQKAWQTRGGAIAAFAAWSIAVMLFFATRDRWVRKAKRIKKRGVSWPKTASWLIAVGFAGWYAMAQPSVTQILTLTHALFDGWHWGLFLSDPLIFLFWIVIAITTIIWGRGLFCGWMCPFGSMTELIYKIARACGLQRFQTALPMPVHQWLRRLKYGVFILLLIVSVFSMPWAEKLAEVEPFKTTFLVGVLHRPWPFAVFWTVIVGLSIFVERPFCKYLCPMGAALALPTRFRMLALRRKPGCQTCHACANGCGSLAIDEQGRIDQMECLQCLDCMILYYDEHSCPPLAKERKQRERDGLPLTPVGKDGHYIPIKLLK